MNLLANAIEALSDAATQTDEPLKEPQIVIRTQTHRVQSLSSTEKVTDLAVIQIRDNGLGMSQDVLEHIFDPFFTTKPVGKGTGLGLSISYKIVVEQHGGQLRCLYKAGQGTSFIVEIPLNLKPSQI